MISCTSLSPNINPKSYLKFFESISIYKLMNKQITLLNKIEIKTTLNPNSLDDFLQYRDQGQLMSI